MNVAETTRLGPFAPTVDTEGVPSVQETPEQRERDNHTLVAEKKDQGLQGDPKEFIPGYYKEVNTVTILILP